MSVGMVFYLNDCRSQEDFTPDINTAKRMAAKKARLFCGEATLIEFEFNEDALKDENLNVRIFPERATEEWAEFVFSNRERRNDLSRSRCYDIIIGPIADDGVAYLLDRFKEGTKNYRNLQLSFKIGTWTSSTISAATHQSNF